MDHYATRYPTNVVDIANFLVRLSGSCLANSTKFLASLCFPSTLIVSRASNVSDDLFYTSPFTYIVQTGFLTFLSPIRCPQVTRSQSLPYCTTPLRSRSRSTRSVSFSPKSSACRTGTSSQTPKNRLARVLPLDQETASYIQEKLRSLELLEKGIVALLGYLCLRSGGLLVWGIRCIHINKLQMYHYESNRFYS